MFDRPRDLLFCVLFCYLASLVAVLGSWISGQSWPLMFAAVIGAGGVIVHVAEVLFDDSER